MTEDSDGKVMNGHDSGQQEDKDKPSLRAFIDAKREREASQQTGTERGDRSGDTPPSGAHATPPEPTQTEEMSGDSEGMGDDTGVQPEGPDDDQTTRPQVPSVGDGGRDRYAQPIKPREVRLDEFGMPLPPGPDEADELEESETAPSGLKPLGMDVTQRSRTLGAETRQGDTPPHGFQPIPRQDTQQRTQTTKKAKPRRERAGKRITFASVARTILRVVLWGLAAGLVLTFVATVAAVFYYIQIINTVDFPSGPDRFEQLQARALQFETTRIYDQNGAVLHEINDPSGGRRDYVTLDQVSPWAIHATVSTEDENFFTNPGFSIPAIIRAVYQAVQEQEVVSGASTITQQLTRALLLPPEERSERTVQRKIKEIFVSAELSRRFSKEEILELYLNQIYYGNLAYGIEAASQTYFDKPASDLNLAEASFLAGIPQQPAVWDPVTNLGDRDDPDVPPGVLDRQEQVVRLMVEASGDGCVGPMADGTRICVSEQDIENQVTDFFEVRDREYEPPSFGAKYPHWVVYVQQQLEEIFDVESIYTSGYDVYTTIDPFLQDLAQEQVEQQLGSLPPERNVGSAAVVAIDPKTGAIRAMVGSRDFSDESIDGQINMTITPRQPGSSIKPIVYLAAFEEGWTPATVVWDVPIEYEIPGFGVYAPVNYDERFHGPQPVRSALGNSYNTPAVQALDFAGIPNFLDKAHDLGITSLGIVNINTADEAELESAVPGIDPLLATQIVGYRSLNGPFDSVAGILNVPGIDEAKYDEIRSYLRVQEYGLAAALGAGEVPPIGMASAFGAMANGGVLHEPFAIERIELNGEVVFQHQLTSGTQAIPPDDAYLISNILSDHEARTPAFGANSVLNAPFNAAAKTGTTNDFRDNWTVGFHPNLAVAVWVGNPDNSQMVDITGVTGAGPIWRGVMEGALERYPAAEFVRPPTIFEQTVCNDSGTIPSERCLGRTHTEIFSADNPPPGPEEDLYRELELDEYTGLIANEFCPDFTRKETFVVVPAHAREWLLNNSAGQGWAQARGIEPDQIKEEPEGECEADTPRPELAITKPAPFEWVEGPVRVVGTADATNFGSYIVQVGQGANPTDDAWVLVQGDTPTPVHDGVLAEWQTGNFEDGTWTIRLVVFDEDGNEVEDRITVNVAQPENETEAPSDDSSVAEEPVTDPGLLPEPVPVGEEKEPPL